MSCIGVLMSVWLCSAEEEGSDRQRLWNYNSQHAVCRQCEEGEEEKSEEGQTGGGGARRSGGRAWNRGEFGSGRSLGSCCSHSFTSLQLVRFWKSHDVLCDCTNTKSLPVTRLGFCVNSSGRHVSGNHKYHNMQNALTNPETWCIIYLPIRSIKQFFVIPQIVNS